MAISTYPDTWGKIKMAISTYPEVSGWVGRLKNPNLDFRSRSRWPPRLISPIVGMQETYLNSSVVETKCLLKPKTCGLHAARKPSKNAKAPDNKSWTYLVVYPGDFKKFWRVEKYRQKYQPYLVEVDILFCYVRIGPVSQLTKVADPHISLETEYNSAVNRSH